MKKRIFILTSFILCTNFSLSLLCQSSCPNSNLNLGNFTYWEGYYGDFYNPSMYYGFVSNRHVINFAPGMIDPWSCNGLLTIPPGETHSARLGNDNVGAEAEQLRYSISVTPQTNLFIYKYAVVLEDPGHVPEHQPSFTIEVTNSNGVVIDPICGYYYVYAQQGLPGWSTCGNVVWKNWTTVGLNLDPYLGQNINIVFTTRDCEETGHFGYAYLSATCGKLQMSVSYCPQASSASLTAPSGFSYQWSNGQTSQTIVISSPTPGTVYNCVLTAVNGCEVTINATLFPTIVNSDFSYVTNCPNSPVYFTDLSSVNQNEITNWKWDFGDGSPVITGISNPNHSYSTPDIYLVKLIAFSTEGCTDTIIKPVALFPKPNSDFSFIPQCVNNTIPFMDLSTISQGSILDWIWDFGDGSPLVTGNPNPSHAYSYSGSYLVTLIAFSAEGCSDTIDKSVDVFPKPNSNFSYFPQCVNDTIPFFDLSTINMGLIDYWKWDFGDGSPFVIGTSNPKHSYSESGTHNVTLITSSSEGCLDTVIKPVIVYPLPSIQFYKNTELITSDTIIFCPLDTINLNVNNCGMCFEWTKKTEPNWHSNSQSFRLFNPGMGTWIETYYLKVTNENDCISTDSLNVIWDFGGCVGIYESGGLISNLYPNPTKGCIYVSLRQFVSITAIELFNFEGELICKENFSNYFSNFAWIDLEKYQNGIYYIKISSTNSYEIRKILLY